MPQIKGQGVYAKWDEDNVYYPARVDHAHVDGSYTVVFDDGVERTLPRGLIIVCNAGAGTISHAHHDQV
jgi:hypothetical protein